MPRLTDTQERLLRFLAENPDAGVADIMAEFAFKSRNAAYWHIKRLENVGLLESPKISRTGWKVNMPSR